MGSPSLNHHTTTDSSSFILPRLQGVGKVASLAFNEKIKQLMAQGKTIYHFGFGESPFPVPEGARRALAQHAGENSYLPVAGLLELRAQICEFHAQLDGLMHLDPNLVVVAPGSKQLIYLLFYVFNGDLLMLTPSWSTYKPMIFLAGKRVFTMDSSMQDGWKLTPKILEKAILASNTSTNRLLIFCNPDNPTGISYTEADLKALSVVLRKHNVIVLSDEIYGHSQYEGDFLSLAKYYPEGTIISSGLSKCFSAGGWRCGYSIYPKELGALYQTVCGASSQTYSCTAAPMQYAAIHLLKLDEETKEYLKGCRCIMGAVAKFCHRELTGCGIKAIMPVAGYYIFPDFEVLRAVLEARGIQTCEQMCEALFKEGNVALMAGGPAFMRPLTEFTVRLCFVNFDGGAALEGWKLQGCKEKLDQDFLDKYCSPVVQGIKAIVSWVEKQLA
ncbi:aspartate/prephenate aminotransferase-like [Patiria miniata]|uniref:Aminotransferase class I/classII large domain-containing protein n=1 Tax=Patiria miniata TaxID=46514 RepID=A0A914A457_PATMI|nr:aspartate/prephenate aminotransferase-like [Patiria miniata]XP_038058465.1 aspartate/prephenate aminotransferase-like [Patiria miniata]XP_038058466.1 aspartate/prephenate aminotransferase-like [Patiria miniata]